MTLTLAAPTLTQYRRLQGLFASAERGSRKPDRYFVVDNGRTLYTKQASAEIVLPGNTMVLTPAVQLSVAAAWNLILRENDGDVIVANDDVTLDTGTLDAMLRAAEERPDADLIFGQGAGFTLFLPRPSLLPKVGPFDEAFYPAYYEDCDYSYRMKLAGAVTLDAPGATSTHFGSATLKAMNRPEGREYEVMCHQGLPYYQRKWGGAPGHELWTVPFDGKSAS